jgi:hypothetical protein
MVWITTPHLLHSSLQLIPLTLGGAPMLSIGDWSSYVCRQLITGESLPHCSHLITLGMLFVMDNSLPHALLVRSKVLNKLGTRWRGYSIQLLPCHETRSRHIEHTARYCSPFTPVWQVTDGSLSN